nr:sulfakinin [Schistocerca gregaria]
MSGRAVLLMVAVAVGAWLSGAAPSASGAAAPGGARRLEELLLSAPYDDPALVDDLLEAASKRQLASDDYGHMRFGKRQPAAAPAAAAAPVPVAPRFDDYGHFRFGKRRSQ